MKSSHTSGQDISGLVSGRLTALYQTDKKQGEEYYWRCICICEKVKDVRKSNLVAGSTKSCGCSRKEKSIDIAGLIFGKLTALYQVKRRGKNGEYLWHCLCSCGGTTDVFKGHLTNGTTKSCGCIKRELITTHGYTHHPLYLIYASMRTRCYNSNDTSYHNYGGRGITICDEWLNNRGDFFEWAEVNGYKKGLQIDRRNNDGNYSPENCRFVTPRENIQNRRNTVHVLLNGESTTAADAAIELGVHRNTVGGWVRRKRVNENFQHLVTLL